MQKIDLDRDISDYIDHSLLEETLGKSAALVGRFDPQKLFSWSQLDEILSSQRLGPPRLRLAQQNLPAERLSSFFSTSIGRRGIEIPKLNPDELNSVLVDGATLVLDAVDEFSPELRRLVRGFARTFASVPQINLYACFGADPGFGMHWDDHDVFIFQLDGNKHWKVFEPTRPSPSYKDVESPPEVDDGQSPYFDKTLSPGQILYVPRGHWHNVLGMNETTMHLTLGITHPTASDILSWLSDDMKVHELVRRDLPLFSTKMQSDFSRELSNLVVSRLADGIVAEYLEFRAAALVTREEINLKLQIEKRIDDTDVIEWISVGGVTENDDGTMTVIARGKKLTLAKSATEVVQAIYKKRTLRVMGLRRLLPDSLPSEKFNSILLLLAKLGAISIK